MKKLFKTLLALSMAFALVGCGEKGSDTITGTYSYHVGGFDWGPSSDKAVVALDFVVDAVKAEDFVVTETKNMTNWGQNPEVDFGAEYTGDAPRTVTKAYLVDANGAETTEPSKTVALELYVSPNDGSTFRYDLFSGYNSWCNPYQLNITLAEGAALTSAGTAVTSFTVNPDATGFDWTGKTELAHKEFEATDGTKLTYAHYDVADSKTVFVWLHGAGEGGTDPSLAYLGNKVTAFIGEDFQTAIGGANILVAQTPTAWMNEGGEGYGMTGASIYTQSLTDMIDAYVDERGAEKVVVSGCSNGGYMTMVMAMVNGDKYDAYVPICEAVADENIDETELAVLKELPIYFIHCEADDTVNFAQTSKATYDRLVAAGAANVHMFSPDSVVDTTGEFTNADGSAYTYNTHWSWIYFDNNDTTCDCHGTTAWDFIAEAIK